MALVAHVLIVVAVLPMSGANCSMNRILGKSPEATTCSDVAADSTVAKPSAMARGTGLGAMVARGDLGEFPERAVDGDLGMGASQANALVRADCCASGTAGLR